jgi:hypothetical protein
MCSEITNRPCPWNGAVAKLREALEDLLDVASIDAVDVRPSGHAALARALEVLEARI